MASRPSAPASAPPRPRSGRRPTGRRQGRTPRWRLSRCALPVVPAGRQRPSARPDACRRAPGPGNRGSGCGWRHRGRDRASAPARGAGRCARRRPWPPVPRSGRGCVRTGGRTAGLRRSGRSAHPAPACCRPRHAGTTSRHGRPCGRAARSRGPAGAAPRQWQAGSRSAPRRRRCCRNGRCRWRCRHWPAGGAPGAARPARRAGRPAPAAVQG